MPNQDNVQVCSNQISALNGSVEAKNLDAAAATESIPPSGHLSPQQNEPFSSNNFGNLDNGNVNMHFNDV